MWLIEGSVVELADDRILMVLRSSLGTLYYCTSDNLGASFSAPASLHIPNPDSKAHVALLKSRELLMAYNNHEKRLSSTPNSLLRWKLTLATSRNGLEWREIVRDINPLEYKILNGKTVPTEDQQASVLLMGDIDGEGREEEEEDEEEEYVHRWRQLASVTEEFHSTRGSSPVISEEVRLFI